MKTILIAIVALAACTAPTAPKVVVHFVQPETPQLISDLTLAGANVWAADTGVTGELEDPNDQTQECGLTWFDDHFFDCKVTVSITFIPRSEFEVGVGVTLIDTRETTIAVELLGDNMIGVVAHEIGHSLWHSNLHTVPDAPAIMVPNEWPQTQLTDVDKAYVKLHTDNWYSY